MKKLYIDNIIKTGDNSNPGPGRYADEKSFGKKGQEYSMRQRSRHDELALSKSKKLPGPG